MRLLPLPLLLLLGLTADAARPDRLSAYPRLDRRDRLGGSSAPAGPVLLALTDPGNECSGAAIPGLTYTRAGTQPCANASMTSVMLATNQPALEPDGLAFPLQIPNVDASVQSPLTTGEMRVYGVTVVPWGSYLNTGTYVLFHHGGAYDSAGSSTFFVAGSTITLNERTPAGVQQQWRTAVGALTQGPHHIRFQLSASGAPVLHIDGLAHVMSLVAGTAVARTAPLEGAISIGSTSTGQFRLRGRLRDLCITKDPDECPSYVPSERAGMRVVALGDSITSGGAAWATSAVSHPRRLQHLLGYGTNFTVNAGSSGFTTSQVYGYWLTEAKGRGFTHVVLLAGINNIIVHDQSAATAWAPLKAIVDEAKLEGLTVVVSTVFPASLTAPKQAELDALNTLIRDYAASQSLILVDGYALMGDPSNPTKLLPAYNSGDNLHPNEAGNIAFAQAVYDALNPPAPLAATTPDESSSGALAGILLLAAAGATAAGVRYARRGA